MLLQYALPFMMAGLGLILAASGWALKAGRFLYWVACGYVLTGLSLGVQSFFSNSGLAQAAPLTTILYLAGAALITQGAAQRCGDGWHRQAVVWAISLVCAVNAARLAYLADDLLTRMLSLNVTLGLIYLSQLPYLIGSWARLSLLERLLGFTTLQLAVFHFLRAAYVSHEALHSPEADTFAFNLTQSDHWQILLACSVVLSLWFSCLTLICAAHDRFALKSMR